MNGRRCRKEFLALSLDCLVFWEVSQPLNEQPFLYCCKRLNEGEDVTGSRGILLFISFAKEKNIAVT